QGLGAGALLPLSLALVMEMFPPGRNGARVQGALGGVMALTYLAGPFLGGLFTDHASWRWAFYVNVPLGIVLIAIVVLRLRHGFWWFLLIFGGTVFPSQMLLVPLFVGFSDAGLYDTRIGMILIYTGINVPLAAFVLRNFYTGVAFSIFEAARMDGASTWRIFWRVYLPISLSALTAVFILEFTFIWNDLIFGLTLTQTESVRPVMTALAGLMTDVYAGTPVPVGLAAGLVVSLPTVVLFLATQRLFARGLSLGSV
ncbi:ABC transporter permease subunit, partial [Amycolatopsis sp. WAC 04182]|uniref:ABC transporter permease subunit n=1 Tax=Amycolatopsis sp. WAC 04182 TaxID=2203198 RepID=UPI0018F755DF